MLWMIKFRYYPERNYQPVAFTTLKPRWKAGFLELLDSDGKVSRRYSSMDVYSYVDLGDRAEFETYGEMRVSRSDFYFETPDPVRGDGNIEKPRRESLMALGRVNSLLRTIEFWADVDTILAFEEFGRLLRMGSSQHQLDVDPRYNFDDVLTYVSLVIDKVNEEGWTYLTKKGD